VVRKAIVVMAGIMMVIGMLVSPPQSEAATNSCSLDGTYVFSGLGEAGGFFEVLGSLVFTPSKPLCIAGTFTGFVTIQHQGQPVENFIVPPTSIYNVTNDGRFTGNSPVLNLVGEVSMVAGDPIANAVSIVAAFNTGSVFAATLLNKFPVGLEGPQGEPGPQGPTGATGATGPPGPTGVAAPATGVASQGPVPGSSDPRPSSSPTRSLRASSRPCARTSST